MWFLCISFQHASGSAVVVLPGASSYMAHAVDLSARCSLQLIQRAPGYLLAVLAMTQSGANSLQQVVYFLCFLLLSRSRVT